MLIMPFSMAIIYKVLFSDFMRMTSGPYPYFIHLITAVLPWSYFATAVQGSSGSILGSKNIINQIAFPKYLLPLSTVCANLINFLPTMAVLAGFVLAFHIRISPLIIFLPVIIVFHTCLITGLAYLVSALQVIYRDTEYFVQIALSALFFLMPGVYVLEEVINRASPLFVKLYMFNPLVGFCNLYRIVFIDGYMGAMPEEAGVLNTIIVPAAFSIAILLAGYFVFKRYEKKFSDYLNI
jgi:ABC-2 type transport system permease protein